MVPYGLPAAIQALLIITCGLSALALGEDENFINQVFNWWIKLPHLSITLAVLGLWIASNLSGEIPEGLTKSAIIFFSNSYIRSFNR